jgi:hypothetical protein
MPDLCEAHLERAGIEVPAYRLGLCLNCYLGKEVYFPGAPEPCSRCGEMQHRGACKKALVEREITLDNEV